VHSITELAANVIPSVTRRDMSGRSLSTKRSAMKARRVHLRSARSKTTTAHVQKTEEISPFVQLRWVEHKKNIQV
jgi:hypothetical protein